MARVLLIKSLTLFSQLCDKGDHSMPTILLIILILLLIGVLPVFPHSRSFGYAPSGGIGLIVLILLILLLMGRI